MGHCGVKAQHLEHEKVNGPDRSQIAFTPAPENASATFLSGINLTAFSFLPVCSPFVGSMSGLSQSAIYSFSMGNAQRTAQRIEMIWILP
jgi:hypothetical protein